MRMLVALLYVIELATLFCGVWLVLLSVLAATVALGVCVSDKIRSKVFRPRTDNRNRTGD